MTPGSLILILLCLGIAAFAILWIVLDFVDFLREKYQDWTDPDFPPIRFTVYPFFLLFVSLLTLYTYRTLP